MTERPKSKHHALALKIAKGGRNLGRVKNETTTWGELVKRLTTLHRTEESYADFMALPKADQDELKNCKGYWIAAYCEDGRRAKKAIKERSCITFDIDYADAALLDELDLGLTAISHLEWVCHTTRKHSLEKPRLRITVPLVRPLLPDEYTGAARLLAHMLDPSMKTVDPVSFRLAQMMYLPSASHDSHWWVHHSDGELLDGQALLASWPKGKDFPYAPSEKNQRESAAEAEDPREKAGLIGAFCRVFDIFRAIEELIPGIYVPSDDYSEKPRYTYTGGTSTSGAVVEDDGLFLYSHHGSDPCSDQLVNSWDMVRIHKYGELDEGIDTRDLPPGQWPSQKAMEAEFADHPEVIAEFQRTYADEFEDETGSDEGEAPKKPASADPGRPESPSEDEEAPQAETFDADVEDLVGEPGSAPPPKPRTNAQWLAYMNDKHAVAVIAGKSVVLNFRQTKKGMRVTYSNPTDLGVYYRNEPVPSNGRRLTRDAWWLEHPRRRTYEGGVAFSPGLTVPKDTFNLWAGWSVEADPRGSCKRFLHHVRNNVCCGNRAHFEWLLNYWAHMVQFPWEKPGVAVVLKGIKGTGKDTVGEYLGYMFRQNHVVVSQMEHVTGKFNAHQETALLLHVQEAYWAGDKRATSALKALITSPTSMIEPKGINAFEVESFCRLLLTSNEDLVVNASWDERRFAVFEMNPAHAQDLPYFDAIYTEMRNGGAAKMLHSLLERKVDKGMVRTPPNTIGLTRQKIENLRNVELWWYERLFSGVLPMDGLDNEWPTDAVLLRRGELYEDYEKWLRSRPAWDREAKSEDSFGRLLQRLCPGRGHTRPRINGKPTWHDRLPPLPDCRKQFSEAMVAQIEWPDEDDPGDEEDLIG